MLSSTNHLFSNSPTSQIAPPVPQDTSKHLYHTAPDPNWFVFPVTPKEILWPFPPQIWGHHKWREVTERVLSNSLSLGLQASPQLLESHRLTRKCHWCHRLIRLDTSVSYYCPSLLPKLQHCTKNQENLRKSKLQWTWSLTLTHGQIDLGKPLNAPQPQVFPSIPSQLALTASQYGSKRPKK